MSLMDMGLYFAGALVIFLMLIAMINNLFDLWHVIDQESYENWRNRKKAKFKSRL
ncbi:hypothetical protein [Bacillus phage vB_BanS-Thrax5]|nr:hypothetical protein [Bacillus phage vB_BanS-Thrax5]